MVLRNKSIFHLGEDDGAAIKTIVSIRRLKDANGAASEGVEGLRILIHHKEQGSSVVIKSAMTTSKMIPHANCHVKDLPELGFLRTCFLCKRELSPCKDVYMYRGEQGFCSEECRTRQILLNEREEFEMEAIERLKAHHHHTSAKVLKSDRSRALAVA